MRKWLKRRASFPLALATLLTSLPHAVLGQEPELRTVLEGQGGVVTAVAVAPGGEFVASGGLDRTVRIFDLSSGEERTRLTGLDEVWSVLHTPEKERILRLLIDRIDIASRSGKQYDIQIRFRPTGISALAEKSGR